MWMKAFVFGAAMVAAVCPMARAAEHVTLKNGFELDCVRREAVGDKVRLYFAEKAGTAAGSNYMDVAADSVVRVEMIADLPEPVSDVKAPSAVTLMTVPTKEEMHEMLAHAGAAHNIDEDLLASVVRAESGGQVRAVSRTGAQGLMQLMPDTGRMMGVTDPFDPRQNIMGGSRYLQVLARRFCRTPAVADDDGRDTDRALVCSADELVKVIAGYHAGPGAVDKYGGLPPYETTRAYVTMVLRRFDEYRRGPAAHDGAFDQSGTRN